MPIKYLNRSNFGIPVGNSVLFNGSSQYLSATRSGGWLKYANNFTLECFVYFTRNPSTYGGYYGSCIAGTSQNTNGWEITFSSDGVSTTSLGINFKTTSNGMQGVGVGRTFNINTWYHLTIVKSGTTVSMYIDGTLGSSGTIASWVDNNTLNIGSLNLNPYFYYFPGYISNFRIVDGTAVYTSDFTRPSSPLTAVANTAVLTCKSATIVDESSNNVSITNNGSATVSSTVPFAASIAQAPNGIKFRNRNNSGAPVPTGNSVLFNGSNQYLSVARILDNSTDVTIEAWVRATSTPVNGAYVVSQYVVSAADRTLFGVGTDLKIFIQIGSTSVTSAAAITLNTWYHLAWVRSGSGANNFSIYINGVRDGQMTYTGTFQNTPTTIGGSNNYDVYGNSYFPGYISNLRILKGTALYTGASFTPPTAPLTAIANTSLLTCNAATIIDGSTNNFTITNNNSAAVSSTTPFTIAVLGSTMKLKKVYADPVIPDFTISPAYSGKSSWNLTVDGPLVLSSSGAWTIIPVSNFNTTVKMWGAGGARGYSYRDPITSTAFQGAGGAGGYSTSNIAIQTGNSYIVQVGQGGIRTTSATGGATYLAGGVQGSYGGTQGGGYSGIFITSVSQANALLMAGGGGGGSDAEFAPNGGAGGGTSGQDGAGSNPAQSGKGGSQSAGGAAAPSNNPTAGSELTGGLSVNIYNQSGQGAGGGGYWGGGGGNVGGGGGGSGRIGTHSSVTGGTTTTGTGDTPGNSSDADRGGAGRGGNSTSNTGADGRIIITKI